MKRVRRLAVFVVLAAGAMLADRADVFGRKPAGDVEKYDGQSFRVEKVVDGEPPPTSSAVL